MTSHITYISSSPVGPLKIEANATHITSVYWATEDPDQQECEYPIIALAVSQLREYFAGNRTMFDVPIAQNGTDFQKEVWRSVAKIPYGSAVSYGTIAEALGRPTAYRAVARAIGANPVVIIVPCHRVLGATGSLTGFSGGLETKKYLLNLEKNRDSERT